jgi:hypothetical protein
VEREFHHKSYLLTVLDKESNFYSTPIYIDRPDAYINQIKDLVNEEGTNFNKKPSNYEVYMVAKVLLKSGEPPFVIEKNELIQKCEELKNGE